MNDTLNNGAGPIRVNDTLNNGAGVNWGFGLFYEYVVLLINQKDYELFHAPAGDRLGNDP